MRRNFQYRLFKNFEELKNAKNIDKKAKWLLSQLNEKTKLILTKSDEQINDQLSELKKLETKWIWFHDAINQTSVMRLIFSFDDLYAYIYKLYNMKINTKEQFSQFTEIYSSDLVDTELQNYFEYVIFDCTRIDGDIAYLNKILAMMQNGIFKKYEYVEIYAG
ncbi:hypothetical protein BMW23_0282 [Bodo saltans virus]|uniref:Uncharacterized protein n=1 Tax=Bodo saltans virus TaxID=2024608 RepID=A0A2H4UTR5_9VIRU|nr:hypothetical protein QJ851_gp0277 [Bodo saltans virus]ATZ80340.1 hypothetical protein BMW23_0282 [Bodo saltans virus]